MPTLSLYRLTQILDQLSIDRDAFLDLSSDPAALALLLEGCRLLAELQRSIDTLEDGIGRKVGWPRLAIELDHHDLVFVSSLGDIDTLVQVGRLSDVESQLLKADLAQQQALWRRAAIASGLSLQRRREGRLAQHLSRSTAAIVQSRPGESRAAIWVRLVIILAAMEPGEPASALFSAIADLRPHLEH